METFKELFEAAPDDGAFKIVMKFLGYKLPGRVKDGWYLTKSDKGFKTVQDIIKKDFKKGERRFASRNGWSGVLKAETNLMDGTAGIKVFTLTSPDGEKYADGGRWNTFKDFKDIKLEK